MLLLLIIGTPPVHSGEPYNYGQVWNSRTDLTRDAWLKGFSYGVWRTCEIVLDTKLGLPVFKEIRGKIAFPFSLVTIRKVMTDLYSDPANTFVPFGKMVYIAQDKLKGKAVENALREAGKEAIRIHEIYEKLKKNEKPKGGCLTKGSMAMPYVQTICYYW